MEKKEETLYDKKLKWLKNNKWLVTLFIIISALSILATLFTSISTIKSFIFSTPKSYRDSVQDTLNSTQPDIPKQFKSRSDKQENTSLPKTYISKIVDNNGIGVASVEIFCSNCQPQLTYSSANGTFKLTAKFSDKDQFWNSTLSLSKDGQTSSQLINWREASPQPITF